MVCKMGVAELLIAQGTADSLDGAKALVEEAEPLLQALEGSGSETAVNASFHRVKAKPTAPPTPAPYIRLLAARLVVPGEEARPPSSDDSKGCGTCRDLPLLAESCRGVLPCQASQAKISKLARLPVIAVAVQAEYHKVRGPPAAFYTSSLQFLAYTPSESLSPEAQRSLAVDMSLAALVGEGTCVAAPCHLGPAYALTPHIRTGEPAAKQPCFSAAAVACPAPNRGLLRTDGCAPLSPGVDAWSFLTAALLDALQSGTRPLTDGRAPPLLA